MRVAPLTLLPILLVVALHTDAGSGTHDRDVSGWLQAMVKAVRSLNYEGTFVYLYDRNLETMRVVHRIDGDGETERLISLNGAAREVVRDDASVTCIAPDARSVLINGRHSGGLQGASWVDIQALSAYYDFRLLDRARVAGRPAQVVAIMPRDNYRYGYRLYLDEESALPLKTDMLNVDGSAISQVMFTSIQIDPPLDQVTGQGLDGQENYSWVQSRPMRALTEEEQGGWRFERLPQGFRLDLQARMPAEQGDEGITHFVISDGLASLSVYVERQGGGSGLLGGSQMGVVNAYGKVVDGFQITAVGSVPAATVESVAGSVRRLDR